MTTTLTIEELEQSGERELGTSDWHEITQEQINLFAEATGDHQWIHVDSEAAANGPFGTTVAHGYLTLSMLPMLLSGPSVVWYVGVQIEVEGKEKPALVGEVVYMAAGAPDA